MLQTLWAFIHCIWLEAHKVAEINRNRKLWLNEAWKHYWSVIFSGGGDWRTDLEGEIRKCLYSPGETSGFLEGALPDFVEPSWASVLELDFQGNAVAIKFQNTDFGNFPLFTQQIIPALGNWRDNNPLERAGGLPDVSVQDREKCRDILIAAVRQCGNTIQNHLLHLLKEIQQPMFEVYCRPAGDGLSAERKLPEFALSEICRIDIPMNSLQDRLGIPKYCWVQIKQRKPSQSKVGPRGSFREHDAAMVTKMKTLIDSKAAKSVRQAATIMLPGASRRDKVSDDSVIRRLQSAFSKQYPNYINRRGQKNPRSPD